MVYNSIGLFNKPINFPFGDSQMLKIKPRKIFLYLILIIAIIVSFQVSYYIYVNIEESTNHKRVEEILDQRLKNNWDGRNTMLEEINTMLDNGNLTNDDMGRLYERAGIIYFNNGESATYYKYLGYAIYYLERSDEVDYTINVYLDLANFYLNNYDYDSAEAIIAKAQQLRPFDEIENLQIKSYAYRIMGITSFLRYNYNDAETYLNQAIRILDEGDTSPFIEEYTAMCDVWLARIYEETGRLPKCKDKLDKWADSYMFTTDIYRNIYLRDFIIPYYQAKCYYLCAENIKEYHSAKMDTSASEQAVIEFLREFMELCEENDYEKAELYTLLKVQKEYPTKNEAIQSELYFVLNNLYSTLFKQQNLTYTGVVSSIVDSSEQELATANITRNNVIRKYQIGFIAAIALTVIICIVVIILYNSRFDGLTNVLNRKAFDFELARMKRSKSEYGIIMIDIDDFKSVNDTYGHPEGDVVLWRLGELMIRESTSDIRVFRYGGEEFVILCSKNVLPYINAIAERIRQSMPTQAWEFAPGKVITISLGTATGSGNDDVVKMADDNLYRAKTSGKNKVVSE